MKEEGFYVERRRMSVPIKKRSKASFGSAFPIELPTTKELDIFADGYVTNCVSCKNRAHAQVACLVGVAHTILQVLHGICATLHTHNYTMYDVMYHMTT